MRLVARTGAWAKAGALLLVLAACGGDPLDRLAEGGRGRVEAALAGGLVRLEDGSVVRLAGVDVPGRGEPGWAEARAELGRVTEGRAVSLLHGGARQDGFGRTVAHVRTAAGRRWVQGELLDAGVARVRTAAGDRALAREMLEREARARIAGRGLWASEGWRVRLAGEAEPGFALVEGRIDGSGRELRFERSNLALNVSGRARADLTAAGRPAEALRGERVRARGVVRPGRRGLVIAIDYPEQIEMLSPSKSQASRTSESRQ